MSHVKTYVLTHPQQRIWYTEKLHPGTGMWNIAGTIKVKGTIDTACLERAVNMFLQENEATRLRVGVKDDTPYQYVSEYHPISIDILDYSEKGRQKVYEWDEAQTLTPMPLIDSDMFYFAMIRLSKDECWLYTKFHHINTDALSMVEYTNQVMGNYQHLLSGKASRDYQTRSYIEYIHEEAQYLASKRFIYDQNYWMKKFEQLPEPTVLKQKKTNYFGTEARRKAYVIPENLSQHIREYCKDARVSMFSLFLSALAIYINRITNKKDIIIGAPVANRTSLHAKGAFGMFVSTVPIRIKIDDDLSFLQFAQVVSNEWFSALKHQKYPFDMLVQELRKTHKGLESLYDVTLSYQIGTFQKNADQFTYDGRWHFNGYQATSLCIHLNDREDNGRFIIDYDHHTPFYSAKEIEYIHIHILNIICDMTAHSDKPLYALDLMSEEERNRVLYRFNDTDTDYPNGETLMDLWQYCIQKTPDDAAALMNNGCVMTYAELDTRSSVLALHLKKTGIGADDVVGLLVRRTVDYPVSVLAILKAGGAFLPIDGDLPPERIAYMLDDSGAKALIVSPDLAGRCPVRDTLRIIKTNMPLPILGDSHLPQVSGADHMAYVIYTSGSTGQPKGVQITQRAIAHFVHTMRDVWDYSAGARVLCAASFSFDMSVMEFIPAIMSGATVVLAQEHEVNIPRNMVSLIRTAQVNIFMVTPGRMELLLSDKQGCECLKDFREIGMGGDVLPELLLAKVQQCTKARIINFYGPTEVTICATCTDVTKAKVPNIGRPMSNVKAYILDAHQNPVPIGVPGELYVGGRGVARGYYGKPDMNSERFIDNPFEPGTKLYRTGDLTRWYPLGEIEFLGRIDKQVKIRGYRIELGEIENRLMQVAGMEACAVADREDASGRKFLCAYLVGEVPKKADIKAQLVRDLPAYMIPSYFVVLDSLPMNASGKVDRERLPDPLEAQAALADDFTPPETATEVVLAEIWCEVLGADRIGRDDSFFDIGGDSLSITAVMARVLQRFHVDILLEDVYRLPRLCDFASLIDAAEQCEYRAIMPAPEAEDYPVSSAQQRMWVIAQTETNATAYNIPMAFWLTGKLDIPRLKEAFEKLIARHDVLRTAYVLNGGELRQRIYPSVSFALGEVRCAEKDIGATLHGLMARFDMERPPLLRATLIHLKKETHVLFIDMHHSIGDKRSADILMADLADLYSGQTLRAKEIEYKDYALWQQDYLKSNSIMLQRDYWKDVLSGELPLLGLHTDRPRGAVQTFAGARITFDIDQETTEKLRAFVRQRGTTLYMLSLAVYTVLLSKYTGQEDVIVGTPVAGRTRPEVQDVAGVFINTLPLRNQPRGDMSFSQFFEQLCQNGVTAFAHADCPLERTIADLSIARDASRNPLFDTMIMYAKDTFSLSFGDVKTRIFPFDPGVAKLDLTLELYEGEDGMMCQFEYNTDLFNASTLWRMVAHYKRLFHLLTDAPDTRLCDVSVLSSDELWQVTKGFNQTDVPLPDVSVQSLFEALAASQGQKTALVVSGKRVSFSALNNRANQIAHLLRQKGIGRNTIVALCLKRSVDMIAAIFGVLKAGGGYLPLDTSYPPERVGFMLTDSATKILLTDGSLNIPFDGETLLVQDIRDDGISDNLARIDKMDDIAYVMYTSGSTGLPKGTVIKRRGLLNFYEGVKEPVAYDPKQTSVSITTVSFDIFVCDALLPLLFGATLVLCTEEELRQPHLLARLIEDNDVKFIEATPTRMRIMMEDESFCRSMAAHIEKIMLGGEPVPESLVLQLRERFGAQIINAYGPTETTVYSSFKDLSHVMHVTIGRPIANTRIYVLDRYRKPVPIGVLGEGYISGAGVSAGYIGRDELNKKTFLPDPFWPGQTMYKTGDVCAFLADGELEMCGRIDHQIKIRGQRIELGEIEAAIRAFGGIEEAVVKDWGAGMDKYLCAYCAAGADISQTALRAHLLTRLPSYMVPSFFVIMDALPTTLNGKVNRKALSEPDRTQIVSKASEDGGEMTADELKMAAIWADILKMEAVNPNDNFFELGGDSLGVIKVQAAILQHGWSIRTQDFFDHQTLRRICARINIDDDGTVRNDGGIAPRRDHAVPEYAHLARAELKSILLTGATGYLGAHILERLAAVPDAHIYCLVRGSDASKSRQHLKDVLTFYFGVAACAAISQRVTVIKGDVSLDGLGVGDEVVGCLRNVDTVIHSAAITDHVGQSARFEQTNVSGTRRVAALAEALGATMLHISTVSVSGTRYLGDVSRTGEFTESSFYIGQNYDDNVYTNSKFLAEEIVLGAIEKGLNARIFRVGVLTGTLDGRFQMRPEKNAFANRVKTLMEIGCVPIGTLGARVEMTPVDACADAILTLARLEGSQQPIYHVYNTNVMTVGDLVTLLEQNGHAISVISDSEFMQEMTRLSKDGRYTHLGALIEDMDGYHEKSRIRISAHKTQKMLTSADFAWPVIDAEYMALFVRCITERVSKES